MVEVIENKKILPLLWMKVETRFSETFLFTKNDNTRVSASSFHRSVLSMPPMSRVTRTYRIVCTKRGYYNLGSATVTTGDILGITNKTMSYFPKSMSYAPEFGLHVYPIPIFRPDLSLPSHSFQGDVIVRRFFLPDPFMPAGVRDYSPDDPQNLINWKVSAKTSKLVVNRNDYTAESKLMVFFNIDFSADSKDNSTPVKTATMEHALRILATILDMSISNGQKTALYTNSISQRDKKEVSVPPALGRTQREKLFAAIAEMQLVRTRNFHMMLREVASEVRDMDILFMTCYMTKEISIEVDAMRRAGNKVEVFTIPPMSGELADEPTRELTEEMVEESAREQSPRAVSGRRRA